MRRFAVIACLAVVAWIVRGPAYAGEKAADTPTLVVRVQSLNALLQNLGLVVKLVGQPTRFLS